MTRLWRTVAFYASAVLVGVLLGYWLHSPPAPAPSVRVAISQSRAAHVASAKAETVFVHTKEAAYVTRTHYDTARVVDTLTRDSVVYVRRDVADTAIRACTLALNSCAALHAADSAEIHALHVEIAARDAERPSRLREFARDAALLGAGYVAGRAGLGAGLHLSLRVPFGGGH